MWQSLLQTQREHSDLIKAWLDDANAISESGQSDQVFNAIASDLGKKWLDAMQRMLPLDDVAKNPHSQFSDHQQVWEKLKQENLTMQARLGEYQKFCGDVIQDSLVRLKSECEENSEPVKGRELFDLWVDLAEEVYAEKTHDEQFEVLVGDLINSMVCVRQQQDKLRDDLVTDCNVSIRKELDDTYATIESMQSQIDTLEKRIDSLHKKLEKVETGKHSKKSSTKKVQVKPARGSSKKKRKQAS